MIKEKHIAKIPDNYATNNQIWIAIVPHISNNEVVGFYLNTYEDLTMDSIFDTWFKELGYAKEAALEDFGIKESDWKKIAF